MCRPGHISYNRSDRQVLKKSQGRPYETSSNIFCKSFKQIKAYIYPKNIEVYTIQVLCVTQATIEVIAKSWKSPKDVLMRRPPTYFAKVLNRLKPTYLPRTLKYIYNTGVMCHPGHISYNRSDRQVLKKSQGRPYETSCNIICDSFKQIEVYHFYCAICGLGDT